MIANIPLSANITVPIVTVPNTMNDTTAVFQTTCPYGYVVPDQPEKKNIGWIAGENKMKKKKKLFLFFFIFIIQLNSTQLNLT